MSGKTDATKSPVYDHALRLNLKNLAQAGFDTSCFVDKNRFNHTDIPKDIANKLGTNVDDPTQIAIALLVKNGIFTLNEIRSAHIHAIAWVTTSQKKPVLKPGKKTDVYVHIFTYVISAEKAYAGGFFDFEMNLPSYTKFWSVVEGSTRMGNKDSLLAGADDNLNADEFYERMFGVPFSITIGNVGKRNRHKPTRLGAEYAKQFVEVCAGDSEDKELALARIDAVLNDPERMREPDSIEVSGSAGEDAEEQQEDEKTPSASNPFADIEFDL